MFRWLGRTFNSIGFAILGADFAGFGPGSSGDGPLASLGSWWFWLHKDSLQMLQPAVERHISPDLWDPGIQTLLEWPASVQFIVLGVVFSGLSRLLRRA